MRLLAESTATINRLAASSTRPIVSVHSDLLISNLIEEARLEDDRALVSSQSTDTSHLVIDATFASTSDTPSNQGSNLHKERTIVAT